MRKTPLAMLVCLALLTGCLEFNEVTQLRPDGSADFTIAVMIPEMPEKAGEDKAPEMNRELEEAFASLGSAAKLTGKGEDKLYGKQRVWFSATLPSLKEVGDLYSGLGKGSEKKKELQKGREAVDHIFTQRSEYRVTKTKQGTLKISREFKPGKPAPKEKKKKDEADKKNEALGKDMEEMMMNAMTFRFEFFSPTEVLSSNATGKFGQALRWEASLGYLSKSPFKMEMEIASTPELEAALLRK